MTNHSRCTPEKQRVGCGTATKKVGAGRKPSQNKMKTKISSDIDGRIRCKQAGTARHKACKERTEGAIARAFVSFEKTTSIATRDIGRRDNFSLFVGFPWGIK